MLKCMSEPLLPLKYFDLKLQLLSMNREVRIAGDPSTISVAKTFNFVSNAEWFGVQAYDPDLIIGDMLYPCTSAVSEMLFMQTETPKKIPRVLVSALPILDPLVPGVLENYPNPLAYIPQMGTALSNDMVRPIIL